MRRVLPAVVSALLTAGVLLAGPPAIGAQPADPAASTYTSVSPVRVLDTRDGTGGLVGPLGPASTVTLDLSTKVPATATAVVLNVTGVTPSANTFVTVFPSGITRPATSNLNLPPGDIRPIQVTVTLGANRSVSFYNNAGNIHLVADLAGYYGTATGARFTALSPTRLLDTRETGGALGAGATRVLNLANRIPASATAVTFNLTGTDATTSTFVTAFPTGATRPTASSLNLPAGDTRANLVTVTVGANRQVTLYNNTGSTHLIADLAGFYTPDYGAYFLPRNPTRVLDTRTGTGTDGLTTPVGERGSVLVDLAATTPLTATGAALNITAVDATAGTYVTAWGQNEDQPAGSTLNVSAGQIIPNAAVVSFVRARGVNLFNFAGSVHLVADLAGVFVVDEPACVTGCVYAWGDNAARKLGTGQTVADSGTPTQVAGLSGASAVDGGGYRNGYALLTDGTVRAWGDNAAGQLGNGWTGGGSPVPVPVLGLTGVTAIAAGGATAYALREDGTVWAWGAGPLGLLGNGGTADASVPVQVQGLTNVVAIDNSGTTGYAVRADGTAWTWGANGSGALGTGSTVTHSLVPVQVPGLTNITDVAGGASNGYAHRTDGTVWAWGDNSAGQLGNNSTVTFSRTPVQVSGLTGTIAIAAGRYNGYAVKSDGTVWAWGAGNNGALGNNTVTLTCPPAEEPGQEPPEFPCVSRVPVRVLNLSDATGVASFEYGAYALRADETIAAWGFNGSHSLGNDSAYWESLVPVPVLGLSGVSAIGGGEYTGFAVAPAP